MYARVTRIKGDPAKLEQNVEQLKAQLVPVFKQQPGYLGVISVANRETGEGATTTYWDSMENLKASEGAIFAARDRFASEQGAEIQSVHRVEFLVQERKGGDPRSGLHTRQVILRGVTPDKVDRLADSFRKHIVPAVQALPGNQTALLFIDRENDTAFGVSSFETAEQRDAASQTLDPLRDRIAAELDLEAQTVHAEVTHADLKLPVAN